MNASASTIAYSGALLDNYGGASNDFVTAGTFKPGFNPTNFFNVYGDGAGNVVANNYYTRAVNDGNFRPIGSGTTASMTGAFSGTGDTTGIDGVPIYIWAFDGPNPDVSFNFALLTGTDSTWQVTNGGSTTINTASGNQYVFGFRASGLVVLSGGPVPEPASMSLITGSIALLSLRSRPRRRTV